MNLKIKVERRHFQKAICYTNIFHCPLAEALREIFPMSNITVGPDGANVEEYAIKFSGWSEDWSNPLMWEEIAHYIENPDDPSFSPYEVELLDVPEELISLKQEVLS